MDTQGTKEKILEVASELFAKKGFGGTSVREIAQQAGVNLAAINYHFKNKDNLYWKVFDYNYDWLKTGIEKIGEKELSTVDLAYEVFDFFINSGAMMMNTFKIFLSDNINKPEENLSLDNSERFGPPGQEVFLKSIQKDLGSDATDEGMRWVMKMTFSQLFHFGVVLNTTLMKEKCKTEEDFSVEIVADALKLSVEAHLQFARENKDKFPPL